MISKQDVIQCLLNLTGFGTVKHIFKTSVAVDLWLVIIIFENSNFIYFCTAETKCFLVLQSRDMSRCTNEFVVNQEESQSILQKRLEIAIEREKAHALALSNQVFKNFKSTELFYRIFWISFC